MTRLIGTRRARLAGLVLVAASPFLPRLRPAAAPVPRRVAK